VRRLLPLERRANQSSKLKNHQYTRMRKKLIGTALLAIACTEQVVLKATDNSPDVTQLRARKAELEQEIVVIKAKDLDDAKNAEDLQAKQSELDGVTAKIEAAEAREKNKVLEQALRAQRVKDADTAIKAAVKRGALPAKDEELQEKWRQRCIEDPENIELLAKMQSAPALAAPRITLAGARITREDSVTVLRAYNAERDPRRKAAIFASEISKRITDGEDLPIHAANTMGTLAGEIVAQQALELLTVEEPMINLFSTDFSGEGAKKGQTITSRIVGIPAAGDYHVDNGYVSQAQVFTDVDVTLSAHRFVQAEFNADELSGTSRRLFDEVAPALADGIGADAVSIALAVITAANFTEAPTVEAQIDFDRETVIGLGGALRDRGVRRNRYLLLNGSYYDKLFSDEKIALLAANQKAELISGDEMMPLHGFNIQRCPTLPNTNNLVGFGGGKSAILVAGRVPNDYANALPGVTGGGTSQIITNPKSGISVHLVQFVDHQKGKAYSRMAYILGANKGQIKAGQRLVSAA
jgi:hypothetical protein